MCTVIALPDTFWQCSALTIRSKYELIESLTQTIIELKLTPIRIAVVYRKSDLWLCFFDFACFCVYVFDILDFDGVTDAIVTSEHISNIENQFEKRRERFEKFFQIKDFLIFWLTIMLSLQWQNTTYLAPPSLRNIVLVDHNDQTPRINRFYYGQMTYTTLINWNILRWQLTIDHSLQNYYKWLTLNVWGYWSQIRYRSPSKLLPYVRRHSLAKGNWNYWVAMDKYQRRIVHLILTNEAYTNTHTQPFISHCFMSECRRINAREMRNEMSNQQMHLVRGVLGWHQMHELGNGK